MTFTPLTWPIQEVMVAAEAQNLLKKRGKLKSPPKKRNRNKYYRYHRDHGHDTEDCFRLKIVIEKLIGTVHLTKFVGNNRMVQTDARPPESQQPLSNINVVSRGTSGGEDSHLARKMHAHAYRADVTYVGLRTINQPTP